MTTEIESSIVSLLEKASQQISELHAHFLPASNSTEVTQLGFTQHITPPVRWVYIGDSEMGDSLWYFVVDGTRQPILEEALIGTVKRLFGGKRVIKDKTVYKLCVEVECGPQTYILQSGLETFFSKGLIAGLEAADEETLRDTIAIKVRPGESEKVVFCSLFSMPGSHPIKTQTQYESRAKTEEAAQRVCEKLGVIWEVKDFPITGKT